MKANEVPLQFAPSVHRRRNCNISSPFSRQPVSLRRRRILQFLGLGALGIALPLTAQKRGLAAPGAPDPEQAATEPFWNPAGMDAMTAMFTRRSQREYTGAPLPKEDLQKILAAGMNAPSAHNTQPWSFVVFSSPYSLNRIPKLIPYTQYAVKAGAAVLVCVHFQEGEPRELALLSVACCIQNMLLACHALGYGAVWLQVYPGIEAMDAWRKEAELPDDILPLALVPIGKPVNALPPVNRMDSARVYHETWGKR